MENYIEEHLVMYRLKTLAVVAVMAVLAASCGQETPKSVSPGTVDHSETPTTAVAAVEPVAGTEETAGAAAPEPADDDFSPDEAETAITSAAFDTDAHTTTTTTVECPDGEQPVGGECPDTAPDDGDTLEQQACAGGGGVWNPAASECDHPTTPTVPDVTVGEPPPGRHVLWKGVTSETDCLVAGGTWRAQCTAFVYDDPETSGVVFWRYGLMEEAYAAVDPRAVESDHWESLETGGPWGIHPYLVFYHYNDFESPQTQHDIMQDAVKNAVRTVFVYLTDWVWFPYRYDVSWTDDPDVVSITGVYPMGEQRTLLYDIVPSRRGAPVLDLPLPTPPPIRPTGRFVQPRWPDIAEGLGRDCPPVEQVWQGFGAEVTDPCTLAAVEQVMDGMWRGDAPFRQWAIRDGYAMIDFLYEIDNLQDPFLRALMGFDSRVNGGTEVRNMTWAGRWPGASMIHLEWKPLYVEREFTPEEQAAKVRYYQNLQQIGVDVSAEWLGDEQLLSDIHWRWKRALIVRTADGTWRMSYRSVCYLYESLNLDFREEGRLLCPDDPNPHFPDSAWFDHDLHPPSHKEYHLDRRAATSPASTPHQDGGLPRRNREYVGTPPS